MDSHRKMVLLWEKRKDPPFLAGYAFFIVVGLNSQCSFLFSDLSVKKLLFVGGFSLTCSQMSDATNGNKRTQIKKIRILLEATETIP